MVKIIIIIKAQSKKKKSGPDLECYEGVERHEIWIDGKSKSNVAGFREDKKKKKKKIS
jgi:hypothetical protein